MGFGFASLIASPVIARLISGIGISITFYLLGAVYFVIMFLSSLYLSPSPKDWKPERMKEENDKNEKQTKDLAH